MKPGPHPSRQAFILSRPPILRDAPPDQIRGSPQDEGGRSKDGPPQDEESPPHGEGGGGSGGGPSPGGPRGKPEPRRTALAPHHDGRVSNHEAPDPCGSP